MGQTGLAAGSRMPARSSTRGARVFLAALAVVAAPLCATAQTAVDQSERAGSRFASVDTYPVLPRNVFTQVALTPDLIERVLAAMPEVARAEAEEIRAINAAIRTRGARSSSMAIREINELRGRHVEGVLSVGGIEDPRTFYRARQTLMIAFTPEDLDKTADFYLPLAAAIRADPVQLIVQWPALNAYENGISIAQQAATPENTSVAAPFKGRFMAVLKEVGRINEQILN
jgi:hypothetical protein